MCPQRLRTAHAPRATSRTVSPAPYRRLTLLSLAVVGLAVLCGCSDREPLAAPLVRPRMNVVAGDYVVTTTADDGAGSLRQAILVARTAASAKTIVFDIPSSDAGCTAPGVCTITLTSTLPTITNSAGLTIDGTGQSIAVSGNDAVAVMRVGSGAIAALRRLTITRGFLQGLVICGSVVRGGAGICNEGTLNVDQSTFSLNHSPAGYGGAIHSDGALTVTGSAFSGNQAAAGGAISNNVGSGGTTITNSTFAGNSGGNNGGALYARGTPTVTNSTFSGNSATLGGGSIYAEYGGTVTLRNSIVAIGPTGANCAADSFGGTISDGGGNLSFGDASCPGITGDPKLGPLQVNAPGTTATMALGAGSAALDAALDASCPAIDQRGVNRPQGAHCDIGAYEVAPPDNTSPVITPNVSGTLGSNGWYTSPVTVSWTVTDAESAVSSQTGCGPTTIITDTPGQTFTCSATSAGGPNSQSVTIKRDATAPAMAPTVSPNPVLLNGSATAAPNAGDAMSGVASASCAAVSTAAVGAGQTVTCTAADAAGNTATASATYQVTYAFGGFQAPVNNGGTLNVAKAGQVVPVKWQITNTGGAPVTNLAAAALTVLTIPCPASATSDPVETSASTTNAGLQNLGDGIYQLNWTTQRAWAGTCRRLQLNLGEGSPRTADFQFK